MARGISSILPHLIQLLLIFTQFAKAKPYEAYPVTKQYPPIARLNQAFSFQISNDTYKSDVDKFTQITYNAFSLPDWLSFDSNSRTFSGTVPQDAVNNLDANSNYFFDVILQGTDNSDQVALNCTYQFVISNTTPIQLVDNFNLLAFLKNFGNTNGDNGLKLSPNEVFNVTFDRTLFQNSGLIKQFYGRTQQYNAPLPNWLFFDPNSLQFSGTSPVINSQIAPEMYFNLVLIATEIEGFSDVEIKFSLIIGGHQLTTTIQNTILLNVTDSGQFDYELPMNYVYLDGSPINNTDLAKVDLVNAPSWVTLSNDTDVKSLSGTLSSNNDDFGNQFSVAVYDKYGDVVYLNFEVESTSDLFAVKSLPNINATRDEWFQYNFLPSQFTNYSNTDVSVVYTNSSQDNSWLHFQSNNLTLQGLVPSDFDLLSVGVVAKEATFTQQLNFTIMGMDSTHHHNITHNHTSSSNHTTSSSSTSFSGSSSGLHHSHRSVRTTMSTVTRSSSASSTISSTSSASATNGTMPLNLQNKSSHHSNKKTVAIACGVVIPVAVIGIILIIIFLLWRSRRQQKNNEPTDDHLDEKKNGMIRDISGPALNNPANNPNQTLTSLENPFDDDLKSNLNNIDLALAGKNAMHLDEESMSASSSDSSYSNEKFVNEKMDSTIDRPIKPTDVAQTKTTSMANPFANRASSFYLDALPASKQSWRYNPDYTGDDTTKPANKNRESMVTLNTVSTSELLNTELKADGSIPKDPRKSTLALRDSVFWGNNSRKNVNVPVTGISVGAAAASTTNKETLQTLSESPSTQSVPSSHASDSTSSTDDFVPVKEGKTFNWVHRNSPTRKPSQKRLVKNSSQGNVDVGQVQNVEGHIAELV
ncbi:axial budding pattern protein 2 [Monosporozyma unispora]|nr:hypothetical protein C6P44_004980 [Kazachstania unispora]